MPYLDRTTATDWLRACGPVEAADWMAAVRAVEAAEEAPEALTALGLALDGAAAAGPLVPVLADGPGRDLCAVLGQLGPTRMLRLLHWLAGEEARDGPEVLKTLLAGGYGPADAVRAVFHTLHRRELLTRMFDPARVEALVRAATAAAAILEEAA